jgi:hypothetical protein
MVGASDTDAHTDAGSDPYSNAESHRNTDTHSVAESYSHAVSDTD